MKKILLLILIFVLSCSVNAQENFSGDQSIYIGTRDTPPALSKLSPEIPERHFHLSDANIFRKEEKREINMLGIVERERRFKESIADYETPAFRRESKPGNLEISDNVYLYHRASNYDYYTGKLKNPVYQEMKAHLFNDFYRLNYTRNTPYYSPFLR